MLSHFELAFIFTEREIRKRLLMSEELSFVSALERWNLSPLELHIRFKLCYQRAIRKNAKSVVRDDGNAQWKLTRWR